jgi:hypothetical protein
VILFAKYTGWRQTLTSTPRHGRNTASDEDLEFAQLYGPVHYQQQYIEGAPHAISCPLPTGCPADNALGFGRIVGSEEVANLLADLL